MIYYMAEDDITPKSNPAIEALIKREREKKISSSTVAQIATVDVLFTDGIIVPDARRESVEAIVIKKLEHYLKQYAERYHDMLNRDLENSEEALSEAIQEIFKLRKLILEYVADGDLEKLMRLALA